MTKLTLAKCLIEFNDKNMIFLPAMHNWKTYL